MEREPATSLHTGCNPHDLAGLPQHAEDRVTTRARHTEPSRRMEKTSLTLHHVGCPITRAPRGQEPVKIVHGLSRQQELYRHAI